MSILNTLKNISFKKKKQEAFDDEIYDNEFNDNVDHLNNDYNDSNSIEDDININGSPIDEFNEQKNNIKEKVKKNKKIAIAGSVVIALGIGYTVLSPIIDDMISSNSFMSNSEFEMASQEVEALTSGENLAIEVEKARKAEERAQKRKQREIEKSKEQELTNLEENKKETLTKVEANIIPNEQIDNNQLQNKIEEKSKPIKMAENKRFIQSDGEVYTEKVEKEMDKIFDKSVSNIEQSSLEHNLSDELDPFAQEYSGTINSRAMKNELIENISLMREYISFLDTKKQFEEAKLDFEKKKRKNIFEEEIAKAKNEFLEEVSDMRQSINELRNLNSELSSKLKNAEENIANGAGSGNSYSNINLHYGNIDFSKDGNAEALDNRIISEMEERKKALMVAMGQKVYKIGSSYLLEEMDEDGNTKVYREGNAYRGHVIQQITPEMMKIKDHLNNIIILPIASDYGSFNGVYSKVEIEMPTKMEIASSNSNSSNSKDKKLVEDYNQRQQQQRVTQSQERTNQVQNVRSRFLN